MTRGVLMYAHNNTEIDYLKIACANALMVQKNLNVPVALVTDESTLEWGYKSLTKEFIDKCFETIIPVSRDHSFSNARVFQDTASTNKTLQFYNCNHWAAYELSPYDETLFIDADYLIMSQALSNCWGSETEFMINHSLLDPNTTKEKYSNSIDDFGIKLYWATVIYFKKTEFAKLVFDTVRHIQENYNYYKQLYFFKNGMYRNDHAFSIAIHMLNGFVETNSMISELPITGLMMAWDTCDIHDVTAINDITIYAEKDKAGLYTLSRLKEQDIHIINKWSISRVSDKLIELYNV
jgi:hypothetical protein